mgnify:CR=1 FL=1
MKTTRCRTEGASDEISEETKHVGIRMPVELIKKMDKLAKEHHRDRRRVKTIIFHALTWSRDAINLLEPSAVIWG